MQQRDLSDHTISTLIGIADRKISDDVYAALAAAGFGDVRRTHGPVFEMIDPGGARITELARRARMTRQGMGQLVADLEILGYVVRRPDPTDARAKLVALTPKGQAAVTAGLAALTELENGWAAHLGEHQAAAFRAALEEICLTFGQDHIR